MQIAGNVALVTGAASGLGAATAERLRAAGVEVVGADLNEAQGFPGRFVRCDVTSEEDVAAATAAAAEAGRFSMLVHCAGGGIAQRTLARDGTPHALDAFRRVVELNLIGSFNVLRLAAAQMTNNQPDDDNERGACVLTASIAGYEGQIGQVAYGSAKAGVIGMTIIAARDLAAVGIRVNTIAPGTIATPPMMMAPDADARRVRGTRAVPEASRSARRIRRARATPARELVPQWRSHPPRRRHPLPTQVTRVADVLRLRAGRCLDVGEPRRLVRIGVRAARETVVYPVQHVGGRRRDDTGVALAGIHPAFVVLADRAEVLGENSVDAVGICSSLPPWIINSGMVRLR